MMESSMFGIAALYCIPGKSGDCGACGSDEEHGDSPAPPESSFTERWC